MNKIKRLEELSALRLDKSEEEKLSGEIEEIIEYVGVLSRAELENEEPLTHLFGVHNVMRTDEEGDSLERSEALKNAGKTRDGYILVPRAVGGRDNE
ncbi:MAG: Asp-tRNA(Asn)/Glu-tRNA(Gln) amidotransferase subunit GatC [Eubacterium sp.]|nr:Asp-tRNA(Asn)/Glu-tRNA(Gln) amidotransferase subunit GatC [Eubacterium sp.]